MKANAGMLVLMTQFVRVGLLGLITLALISCETSSIKEVQVTDEFTYSEEEAFNQKVEPKYAKGFTVEYFGNYKVVRTSALFTSDAASSSENVQDILVLVQKGTKAPLLEKFLENASIISIPVNTAAVNVQHSESFLREIGMDERINAIGGLYSYNDEMREKATNGEVGQIGYSWHSPPNFEVLLKSNPEVFLMTLASLDHKESLDKCRKLGIPTATVFDWAESDYLARAEWVKFYSLFFNAEKEANQVFKEVEERVNTIRKWTQTIDEKESALWGYYTSKQQWHMHINSFCAQYMNDAGLINALANNTSPNADGIQIMTTEELLSKGESASHWVIGDIHATPLPEAKIMKHFKSWNSGKLYHNMKSIEQKENTSNWYAKAIVRPEIILEDLVSFVYPDLLPEHTSVFIGNYDRATEGAKENM